VTIALVPERGMHVFRGMPSKSTVQKAKRDLRQGKSPTTAAGEFVHEEIEHVREGKHGARSTKQAIAIGLAKARRAGVPLPPPRRGQATKRTRRAAQRDLAIGQGRRKPRAVSRRRAQAAKRALGKGGKSTVSRRALSRHAKQTLGRRRKRSA